MSTGPVQVYLVDPHPITRAGVYRLFREDAEIHLVGDASTAADLLSGVAALPHVVVTEIAEEKSLADIQTLMARHRSLKIIAFTGGDGGDHVRRFLRGGGLGYVLKTAAVLDDLSLAIHAVAEGRTYLHSAVGPTFVALAAPGEPLSARELTVLRMLARGQTMKEITSELGLGIRTIETYRARGLRKLDLKTRFQLIRHAVREGWFDVH